MMRSEVVVERVKRFRRVSHSGVEVGAEIRCGVAAIQLLWSQVGDEGVDGQQRRDEPGGWKDPVFQPLFRV